MPFQEGNIYFNKIVILQSLPELERHTGTELHTDTVSRMAWKDPQLITEIVEVQRSDQLLSQLTKLQSETKYSGILPFIHF